MSTAKSNEFHIDLNETDFPYLDAKPSGKRLEKGRRCGADDYAARRMQQTTVMKTIHDPQQVLGKRRKARLLSDCADNMAVGVQYSINRKNRWAQLETDDLLENADNTSVDVTVVEKVLSHKDGYYGYASVDNVNAVHSKGENGEKTSKTAKGRGAALSSLLRKDDVEDSDCSDEDEKEEAISKPRLEYRIMKPHKKNRILVGKIVGHSKQGNRKRRDKKVDISELEASEMEQSVHLDENTIYKPSRDFRFSLGDYITANSATMVHVRRQSIESVKNIDETEKEILSEGPRPFDLLDISAAANAPCCNEWASVNTSTWNKFNFNAEVEKLFSDPRLTVRWLDVNHQRVSIDLTAKLLGRDSTKAPLLFVILEKGRKNGLGLQLNSAIPSNAPFTWRTLKGLVERKNVTSLEDALEMIVSLVRQWKNRYQPEAKAVAAEHPKKHLPTVNSQSMANKGEVVTECEMAEMLREDGRTEEEEPFERIADDEISSEEDSLDFETNFAAATKVKCLTCPNSSIEELFELDDCWKCRNCLRNLIVQQIRTKNIPLEVQFVTDIGGSTFDVLPALLPLPLVNFYTKITAKDLLLHSEGEIVDLEECPICADTVKVIRPNEYNSCRCSGCASIWCTECKHEPHWPLNCEQYALWQKKWEQEHPNVISENWPASIENEVSEGRGQLKKEFTEPISKIRWDRYGKVNEVERKCRKAKQTVPMVGKVPELSRTVLSVLENGLAWVYLQKGQPQGLKSSLIQLYRQYQGIVNELDAPKPNLFEQVVKLEEGLAKIVDQFKKLV